ncbi:MAG: adenosylcobinamide-GDP ribazoletransferase [Clostridia bacterium]
MKAWTRMKLAIQFLTVVPVRLSAGDVQAGDLAASTRYYPFVGLALGGLLWVMARLMSTWTPLLRAALMVSVYTVLTGALHLDGLMDTMDAIGSRKPAREALGIMKDSRVGAIGALSGLMVVLIKVGALSTAAMSWPLMVIVPAVSRLAMIGALATAPPAAREGDTLAGRYAGSVSRTVVVVWALVLVAGLWVAGVGWAGTVLVAAGLLVAALASTLLTRRFGGMTGDTYGAVNELAEVVGWVLASAL